MKKKKLDSKGQALIEFILFVPFMMILYSAVLTLASAINGSINQQKIVRGYFYSRLKHNSTAPTPTNVTALQNVTSAGMVQLGWRERQINDSAVAPCYKIKTFLGNVLDEECEEISEESTMLIRVKTVYGICGNTYNKRDGTNLVVQSNNLANAEACMNVGT